MDPQDRLTRRNKWTFSVGTIGRDMTYTAITGYLLVYLTSVVQPTNLVLAWVSSLILVMRLFDAVLDIVMGSIVDNTRSKWGPYKPWILGGVFASGTFTLLLVTPLRLNDVAFIIVYVLLYLGWSLSWTTNDIPYWSLLPTLSLNQKKREQIGSLAKIFAAIGQFSVAVAIVPVTQGLTPVIGAHAAWLVLLGGIVTIMIIGQTVTLVGTKVPTLVVAQPRVKLREVASIVVRNDQLMWIAIAMLLFMTGYTTTTTFGIYYFRYVFGDVQMYTAFAACVGVATITGYAIFPRLRRRFTRRTMYTVAASLIVVGYLVFFFSPANIGLLGVAGLMLFLGVSFVTVLMLGFITDTIDYGHWKFGHRNTAITFALQPFVNKVGAALSQEVVAITAIVAGINQAEKTYGDASSGVLAPEGQLTMKIVMMMTPLVLVLIGYVIYRLKYRIDERFHEQILDDLRERGQLVDEQDEPTDANPDAPNGLGPAL